MGDGILKKSSIIFITLLLVSLVNMTVLNPVLTSPYVTKLEVIPSSIMDDTLLPQSVQTIRPTADGAFTNNWTKETLTIRPESPEGTYGELTGRILPLNPNGTGAFTQWSSRTYLIPDGEGNWSQWYGTFGAWDDWPNPNDDTDFCVAKVVGSSIPDNQNKTSDLEVPLAARRVFSIDKLSVNYRARQTTGDEKIQAILNSLIYLNVSSFTAETGWNGWTKVGSDPYLNKTDYPSNYINTNVNNDKIGNFTFYDLPAGLVWNKATGTQLRLRTWQRDGGENDTLTIYLYNGTTTWTTYSITPSRTIGAYYDIDVTGALRTAAAVNAAKIAIKKVTDANGVADNVYVDYASIRLSGVMRMGTWPNSSLGTVYTPPTTGYLNYTQDWPINPITGNAWTWADLNVTQAGVRSIMTGSWSGELRVTQLYVTIFTRGLYIDWDEWPDPNGDIFADQADYIFTKANGTLQSSVMKNHTTEDWGISKVRVGMVARTDIPTDEKVQLMLSGSAPTPTDMDVDGFVEASGWTGWDRVGTSTWLSAPDDGKYIYRQSVSGSAAGRRIGDFSFENVPGGITWSTVFLRIKTWQVGSQYNDGMYIQLYDGSGWSSPYTVIPTSTASPGTYMDVDVSGFLNSIDKINLATMRIEKFSSDLDDTVYVDHAYLRLLGVYCGPQTTLTTTYKEYTQDWINNPITGSSWTWQDIDNLQVGVKSLRVGTTWSGELRVTQLYVKVIEAGSYTLWDEPVQNGDTDYISAVENAKSQSSQLQNSGTPSWTIAGVQVSIVARTDVTTNEKIRIMLVVYGTRCYSPSFTLTTTYSTYSYLWTKNARWTALDWNWTTIDALEAGVYSEQGTAEWTGEIRITQLYVVVAAPGTYDDWNDTTPDGDATYVSATMPDLIENSALQDIDPDPTWEIARVRVVIVAKATSATDEKILPMLVLGGVPCLGPTEAAFTPEISLYKTYTWDWGKNPRWPIPWNWTAIDALEAGVKSVLGNDKVWTGELRVTQLYVQIAGPRFTIDIKVTDVTNLKAYEFFLNYTTGTISATAIILGPFLKIDPLKPPQIWVEKINDTAGYVYFSASVASGPPSGPPGSGTGILATIIFLVDHYYDSPLDLDKSKLVDSSNLLIDHDVTDGYFRNRLRGDVNGNRNVEDSDLSSLNDAYGSVPGESNWNLFGDIHHDDKIDALDLFDLGKNYGASWPS